MRYPPSDPLRLKPATFCRRYSLSYSRRRKPSRIELLHRLRMHVRTNRDRSRGAQYGRRNAYRWAPSRRLQRSRFVRLASLSFSGARRRAPESVEWFKRCEIFLSTRTMTRRTQRRALRTPRGKIVHGVSRHRAPRDRWLLGSRSRLDDALKRTIPTLRLTTKLHHVARPRSRWLD